MLASLLIAVAFQSESYLLSGMEWAREPMTGSCYVEMAAGMEDPSEVRDFSVRVRLREQAQKLAGLAWQSFFKAADSRQIEVADMQEARDFAATGIYDAEEVAEAAAEWGEARQKWRQFFAQIQADYPNCDFLRPLRDHPAFDAVLNGEKPEGA